MLHYSQYKVNGCPTALTEADILDDHDQYTAAAGGYLATTPPITAWSHKVCMCVTLLARHLKVTGHLCAHRAKNLQYEEREQLDSGGGGALSQGAGHDGSIYGYTV